MAESLCTRVRTGLQYVHARLICLTRSQFVSCDDFKQNLKVHDYNTVTGIEEVDF